MVVMSEMNWSKHAGTNIIYRIHKHTHTNQTKTAHARGKNIGGKKQEHKFGNKSFKQKEEEEEEERMRIRKESEWERKERLNSNQIYKWLKKMHRPIDKHQR